MQFNARTKDQPTPRPNGDIAYDRNVVPSGTVWTEVAQSP